MKIEEIVHLRYNDQDIECKIIRKKIKNIYILVQDKEVIVKAPIKTTEEVINTLLKKKSKWIYTSLKKQEEKIDRRLSLDRNDYFYFLGNKIKIIYCFHNTSKICLDMREDKCIVSIPEQFKGDRQLNLMVEKMIDRKLNKEANIIIPKIMEKYINLTGLCPKEYKIRKFKRIWGNCSSKKEIKINQNIIWYSKREIEYVCLHELCHLKHMNHKKEFWSLIYKYMPDYKERIKILKNS